MFVVATKVFTGTESTLFLLDVRRTKSGFVACSAEVLASQEERLPSACRIVAIISSCDVWVCASAVRAIADFCICAGVLGATSSCWLVGALAVKNESGSEYSVVEVELGLPTRVGVKL